MYAFKFSIFKMMIFTHLCMEAKAMNIKNIENIIYEQQKMPLGGLKRVEKIKNVRPRRRQKKGKWHE